MKTRTLNITLWTISIVWTVAAITIGSYLAGSDVALESWIAYYKWFIFIGFIWAVACVFLFTIGGIYDLIVLFRELNNEVTDVNDNGQVHNDEGQLKF